MSAAVRARRLAVTRSILVRVRETIASTVSVVLDGIGVKMPIALGTAYGSCPSSSFGSWVEPWATTEIESAAIISRVRCHGGSMTTSPTNCQNGIR